MGGKEKKLQIGRKENRRLMIAYDILIYAISFALTMGVFSQFGNKLTTACLLFGCVLFIVLRLLLGVYKKVLRIGNAAAFARLICADAISSAILIAANLVIGKLYAGKEILFIALLFAIAAFILASIVARIMYYCIYRLAISKSALSRPAKFILERFALVDFNSAVSGATLRLVLESQNTVPTYINELQWVVDKFAIRGQVTGITQINSGYINRTYRVETISDSGHVHKYTLQRINTNVFKDVDALMANYKLTTETLHGKLCLGDRSGKSSVQTLRVTKDGRSYLTDKSGCWRMMKYIDNVYSMDIPNSLDVFERAGYAFGNFIKAMSDIDISAVKEVIPNFHNTKNRYADLEKSIELHKDGRVKDVLKEIEFIRERADKFGMIADALENGEIPKRICHNDCNLNNILFDKKTHKPVAIIDLDTVMPSSPLYDFGDSMRIGTNTAKDDEKDLSKVSCDLNMYEHYARGYLRACGDVLTERELELLPYAALIITSEDGIRFLMDHIDGDIYYNICYPGQNLDRARTQLKLVEDMEKKLPQIKQILRKIYAELGLKANI